MHCARVGYLRASYDQDVLSPREQQYLETIKKLKIELESEKAKNRKIEGRNRIVDEGSIHPKLEELRAECGELGHFWGHYFDNDKSPEHGGVRLTTNTDDMKMVLRMVALGEKKINLKFSTRQNNEVDFGLWTMKYITADHAFGGNGTFYLWIGTIGKNVKFTAKAQEINERTGEKLNRKELESKKEGHRQLIMYKRETRFDFVRFNITFM
ncbi:unnamed protein product [Oikopleura dioica]|uniref:Uncharacterized protein n=1 Tax=Oikopleura dioica TaxID=34765 RepID=E4XL35_OIKDI|nr:unnamed protein product [Oikopleura dioica]